jgi:signal transduction histidine kinase
MRLRQLRKARATLSFKISIWSAAIFTISTLTLFLVAYTYFSVTLKKQDHEEIELELKEVSSLYGINGVSALGNFIAESSKSQRSRPLFIRIADKTNKTLHVFTPQLWRKFELNQLEIKNPNGKDWIRLKDRTGEDFLEIRSNQLAGGFWIQVGINSHEREITLKQFRKLFALVMIPLILIGLAGGILISYQFLKPIRQIIHTMRSIETGSLETRVPRTGTKDELDELARLFNEMLDRISNIILGMKASLDNVAHDLRTPMTRFRNIAETAMRAEKDANLYREALADAVEESESILKMLNILMDISEAQTGVMYLDRQVSDVSALIVKIVDMYQLVAEEKGLQIHFEASQNMLSAVDIDRMSQALANLLDNAIKYTLPGGRISLKICRNSREILIIIQDSGVGIPANDLPHIWERLYRSNPSRQQKGIGLGLSLVRGIVESHGGWVKVTSELGKGSTFTISLPAVL